MILHSQTLVRDGRDDYDGTQPTYMAHGAIESATGPDHPTAKQRSTDKGASAIKRPSVHNAKTPFNEHKTPIGGRPVWSIVS